MSRRINCEVRHMYQAAPHSKIVAVFFLSHTAITSRRNKSASSSRSADAAADRARQETGLQYASKHNRCTSTLTIVVAPVRIDITYYQLVDDSDKPRCSRRRKLENSDTDYIIKH